MYLKTELQDLAWSILPKEFKEEVKRVANIFSRRTSGMLGGERTLADTFLNEFIDLFGLHNLTSDAEGEEMLTVSRKKVQEIYRDADNLRKDPAILHHAIYWNAEVELLQDLFGSKCLPDEVAVAENATTGNVDSPEPNVDSLEPKPAEPKFKVGDEAFYVCSPTLKHKCTVTKVMQNEHNGKREYNVMFEWGKPGMWILESDLEPYTEPKEMRIASEEAHLRNLSQETVNCDKQFDNILKNSFAKDRRLNIAVQFMSAMMSNPAIFHQHLNAEEEDYILYGSLEFADALIAESEKGGSE